MSNKQKRGHHYTSKDNIGKAITIYPQLKLEKSIEIEALKTTNSKAGTVINILKNHFGVEND